MKGLIATFIAVVLLSVNSVLAHDEPLDEDGGHWNVDRGEYHYHVKPVSTPVEETHDEEVPDAIPDAVQATLDAERDVAQLDESMWAIGGCLFGVLGVVYASAYNHTPPAAKLIGKSPEYIQPYLLTYHTLAQKRMTNAALQGCVVGTLVSAAVLLYADDGSY